MKLKWLIPLCLLAVLIAGVIPNQGSKNSDLKSKLEVLAKNFHGDVGIYVRHLKTGETIEINADTLFPTASMIKVPILLKIFDKLDKGELNYKSELAYYADSIKYPYDGQVLWSFRDGQKLALDAIVSLMITYSDNHASLWLQKLATGEAINEWLDAHGYSKTRVNSRTEGRRPNWEVYGWGQTTPREMASLLVQIREGKAVSKAASEEMYRALTRIYWNGEALSQIPPYVQAASKQGAVDASRSEVVLVNAPHGDYVFCVITKNQQDQSWDYDNEGYALIRSVSRMLWETFEPDSDWQPNPESRKLKE
ncbi:MAG: serine hydrolase [Calditrichae bacterium]|nr:serine hydrolase [Calditrichia bacterium]